jgi:hypothetical protein
MNPERLGPAPAPLETASPPSGQSEGPPELWLEVAALLLQATSEPRPLPQGFQAQPASASNAWRSGDATLTGAGAPTEAGTPGAAGPGTDRSSASAGDLPNRLTLKVTMPELGTLGLLLEQSSKGTRVHVSAEQLATFQRLQAESSLLSQTLSAAGLPNCSVQITRGLGTELAKAPGRRPPSEAQAARKQAPRRHFKVIG